MLRWAVLVVVAVAAVAAQDDDQGSTTCVLTKQEQGKTVKYDLNVLYKDPKKTKTDSLEENYWTIEQGHPSESERETYKYYLNVCGELVNRPQNMPSVSVLQQPLKEDGTPARVHYIVGRDSHTALNSLHDGDLRYEYDLGDSCGTIPTTTTTTTTTQPPIDPPPPPPQKFRTATVLFFCADVGLGEPSFAQEPDGSCEYLFVWNTCAACPVGSDIRNACPAKAKPCHFLGGDKLSTGAVLVITFFVLLFFYLVVGVLYRRFVVGAKGVEQLPNVDFWFDLCESIKDGCTFTFCCTGPPRGFSVQYTEPVGGLDEDALDLDDDADGELYP